MVRRLLLIMLIFAGASGCSGGESAERGGAADTVEAKRPGSYNEMLEWYLTRLNADEMARQARIQECMKGKGFDYEIDPEQTQVDVDAALSPIDHSASDLLVAEAESEPVTETTVARPNGYDQALGSEGSWTEDDGSCFAEAAKVETSADFLEVEAAIEASFESLGSEPGYQAASKKWTGCMQRAGFQTEGDFSGAAARLADQFALERFSELGVDTSSGDLFEVVLNPATKPPLAQMNSVAAQVSDYETKIGAASETCMSDSGLAEIIDEHLALVAQGFDAEVFSIE